MRPRRRSRALDALFALLVLVGVWSLAEGALAIAGDPVGPVYNLRPGIRWTLEPDLFQKPFPMVETKRFFRVTTNADGLRGMDTPGPEGGASTLLMLGDSTIFGWGVDDGEDVPSALESALRAHGKAVRVVNGGQPGYSTVQSYMLLREVGLRYEPDLVLLEFSLHDFRSATTPDSRAIDAATSETDYWLAAHSRAYRALRRLVVLAKGGPLVSQRGGAVSQVGAPAPESDAVRVPPSDFVSTLRAAAALGREHGFTFAISFPPRSAETLPKAWTGAATALADAGELVVVDYTAAWRAAGGKRDGDTWLADDPGHYSATGAAVTGRALAQELVEDGLVR
ncbi:MAG: SGNH/GDSL hydrolase family protein [Myxococcota bacterium]